MSHDAKKIERQFLALFYSTAIFVIFADTTLGQHEPTTITDDFNRSVSNTNSNNIPSIGRLSVDVQQEWDSLTKPLATSIVKFERRHLPPLLGTIVSTEGFLITKLSELSESGETSETSEPITCLLWDGTRVNGRLLASDSELDLAVVKIDRNGLTPIELSDTEQNLSPVRPGLILVSVGYGGSACGLGIVSVTGQDLLIQQPTIPTFFELGAKVGNLPVRRQVRTSEADSVKTGIRVLNVPPRTAAERIGLLIDDLIFAVNDQATQSPSELNHRLQELTIGEPFELTIVRNQKILTLKCQANPIVQATEHDRWGGGPFNQRRFQFGSVIIHDSVIRPEDCGGPVINSKGQVVGINIARSLRAATLALPVDRVKAFVDSVIID